MNRQDAKSAKIEPHSGLDDLAHAVIGAAIEVHRNLGPGFLESVYEEALAIELSARGIAFERQKAVAVNYKGSEVGQSKLDFLIDGSLVLELKAVENLLPIHKAQVISYLKTTSCQLGLLINFNVRIVKEGVQRVVLSKN